jgi:fatty acid desaturase
MRENVEEMKETAGELGREIHSTFAGVGGSEEGKVKDEAKISRRRRSILGIILVVLGILFLLGSFDLFWWFSWGKLWPLIIVVIGALIIVSSSKK